MWKISRKKLSGGLEIARDVCYTPSKHATLGRAMEVMSSIELKNIPRLLAARSSCIFVLGEPARLALEHLLYP